MTAFRWVILGYFAVAAGVGVWLWTRLRGTRDVMVALAGAPTWPVMLYFAIKKRWLAK